MRILVLLFGLLSLYSGGRAQTRYAYLANGKTTFQTSSEKFLIGFKEGRHSSPGLTSRLSEVVSDTSRQRLEGRRKFNGFTLKEGLKRPEFVKGFLTEIRGDTDIAYANPYLIKDNRLYGFTDKVIVRLKTSTSFSRASALFDREGVYVVSANPYTEREYFLTIHPLPERDAIDVADYLFESGLFEYSEPDLVIINAFQTNDPMFPQQWNLQNTAQYGGTVGADIKAVPAWCVTTGTGIKVAVIDVGVDLAQPDLQGNLLPGYDAMGGGTNGGPTGDDAHGTAVAGIIASVANNNLGAAGIANTCKIIPVRVGEGESISTSAAVTGIGWAYSASGGNADVMNCSWGGGTPSSSLNTAIANAISSGRGGKGTVMCFATGNENAATIDYPSSQPNVIAVGASCMCDQRVNIPTPYPAPNTCQYDTRIIAWGSNYGTGIGVVAPGMNIATTDISGVAGYSNPATQGGQGWILNGNNYIYNFDGTSAATPHVAATIALILSVNPALTYSQATKILETTTDQVGGYTYGTYQTYNWWNNEMGYGRINASSAVNGALATFAIGGATYFCSGSSSFSVSGLPSSVNVNWTSSNTSIASVGCNPCTTTTLTKGSTMGEVVLTASFSTSCGSLPVSLTKVIWVGEYPIGINSTAGTCSGSTQTWDLVATPSAGCSAFSWTVGFVGTGASIYILSPGSSSTFVDVVGGGTVNLAYHDACNVPQTSGVTVYSSCHSPSFIVSPNPARSTVTVSAVSANTSTVNVGHVTGTTSNIQSVKIFDLSGTLKQQQQFMNPVGQASMDVSRLGNGVYVVQISDGKNIETQKLVIQR